LGFASVTLKRVQLLQVRSVLTGAVDVVGDDKAKLKEQARRTRIAAMAMEDWRHSES
jgi:hypothetical protein